MDGLHMNVRRCFKGLRRPPHIHVDSRLNVWTPREHMVRGRGSRGTLRDVTVLQDL